MNNNNKVTLLGYYGGDESHCLSAWQSTNIELDIELSDDINNRIYQLFNETVKTKKKSAEELLTMLADAGHHCYDDKTEILTLDGWKLFKDLTNTDDVCAVDIQTGACWFEKPRQIYSNLYDEPMYYVQCQQLDLAVTKGHRMVVSQKRLANGSDYGTIWEFQKSEEVYNRSRKYLKSAQLINDSLFSPELAQLIGFFVGEGYANTETRISFHLKKNRKIEYLKSICDQVEDLKNNRYVIKNNGFNFKDCYNPHREKILPGNIFKYSKEDVENILIGLKNSDGSVRSRNEKEWCYFTTSKELKEQLITLACLHNFVFTEIKPKKNSKRNSNHKDCFRLNFSNRIDPEISNMDSRKIGKDYWEHYKGYVYCVTVSTGAVIVRRNGKVCVSGNTPFEKSCLHFQVTADIASHIHIIKHRISTSVNSESARYKELQDKWYLPPDWEGIVPNLKVNSSSVLDFLIEKDGTVLDWYDVLNKYNELGHDLYHLACEDLSKRLGRTRAKESARYFLPHSKQLDFDVMFNFRSFVHFQNLRNSKHAQKEIRDIAQSMLDLVASIPDSPFYYSLKAFNLI